MFLKLYLQNYKTLTCKPSFNIFTFLRFGFWLVYNTFLTAIYDTIKCEDDMSFSYQSADSSQSKTVPPPPPGIKN